MEIINSGYWEILLSGATFCLLTFYHVHLVRKVRREPLMTAIGVTSHIRSQWVNSVKTEHGDILAVHTLRNGLMAANFLASTAMLISLGLLSVAFAPGISAEISNTLNIIGARSEVLWMFKMLILVLLFFFAFFNFTLNIRYYNHAGFMINLLNKEDPTVNTSIVAEVVNRGALHYTMGMRAYYLAVPIGLWLFGPVWMLLGAMVLIFILSRLDHTV